MSNNHRQPQNGVHVSLVEVLVHVRARATTTDQSASLTHWSLCPCKHMCNNHRPAQSRVHVSLVKVLQQLAMLVLDVLAHLHGFMQELGNLLEVSLLEAPGGHGRGSNANTPGGHGRHIPNDSVLVQGYVAQVAAPLHLAASDFLQAAPAC